MHSFSLSLSLSLSVPWSRSQYVDSVCVGFLVVGWWPAAGGITIGFVVPWLIVEDYCFNTFIFNHHIFLDWLTIILGLVWKKIWSKRYHRPSNGQGSTLESSGHYYLIIFLQILKINVYTYLIQWFYSKTWKWMLRLSCLAWQNCIMADWPKSEHATIAVGLLDFFVKLDAIYNW